MAGNATKTRKRRHDKQARRDRRQREQRQRYDEALSLHEQIAGDEGLSTVELAEANGTHVDDVRRRFQQEIRRDIAVAKDAPATYNFRTGRRRVADSVDEWRADVDSEDRYLRTRQASFLRGVLEPGVVRFAGVLTYEDGRLVERHRMAKRALEDN